MSNSNLNWFLCFSFELNPGKKRSILSYKNVYSFTPLHSGPQLKSKPLIPFPHVSRSPEDS